MDKDIAVTLLNEFREFRIENDKRWEENDKRWEENNKRWEANDKRWEENTKSLKALNAKIDKVDQNTNARIDNLEKSLNAKIDKVDQNTNARIDNVERIIKKDRIDLVGILDTMQKTITDQFKEQQDYMEAKFNQILAA